MQRAYDKDPYAILGISPTATASQIKQAYHRLAREYHPDLNKDPRAIERMKDINWAKSILSDPQERALYDMWRSSGVRVEYHPGAASPYSDPTSQRSSSSPNASPRTAYSTGTQGPKAQGCAPTIFIIIFVAFINIIRLLQSTSQPAIVYAPLENRLTQTAEMERVISILETFYAAETNPALAITITPEMSVAPSTATEIQRDEFGHRDLRSEVVPGSWLYDQLHTYFPELITFSGLSDEVTLVVYDQLRGYQIKTRSLGEYWIYIDRQTQTIRPMHFPPAGDGTPTP